VSPDLPCFLLGSGMGALAVNTYLGLNPIVAKQLSGVIYSAPQFGMGQKNNLLEKLIISVCAYFMDQLMLVWSLPIHRLCRSK